MIPLRPYYEKWENLTNMGLSKLVEYQKNSPFIYILFNGICLRVSMLHLCLIKVLEFFFWFYKRFSTSMSLRNVCASKLATVGLVCLLISIVTPLGSILMMNLFYIQFVYNRFFIFEGYMQKWFMNYGTIVDIFIVGLSKETKRMRRK